MYCIAYAFLFAPNLRVCGCVLVCGVLFCYSIHFFFAASANV